MLTFLLLLSVVGSTGLLLSVAAEDVLKVATARPGK